MGEVPNIIVRDVWTLHSFVVTAWMLTVVYTFAFVDAKCREDRRWQRSERRICLALFFFSIAALMVAMRWVG